MLKIAAVPGKASLSILEHDREGRIREGVES
jgi:hypothetical protein